MLTFDYETNNITNRLAFLFIALIPKVFTLSQTRKVQVILILWLGVVVALWHEMFAYIGIQVAVKVTKTTVN